MPTIPLDIVTEVVKRKIIKLHITKDKKDFEFNFGVLDLAGIMVSLFGVPTLIAIISSFFL